MLAAETVARQLYNVLKDDPGFIKRLDDRDRIKIVTQLGPLWRRLADDWTPATHDKVFAVRFDGAVSEPTPLPPDTAIPELEDDTPATEVRVEASGVEVEALRAAAGEQARIAAEDEDAARRQAAHDDALASRYTEGIARRADA